VSDNQHKEIKTQMQTFYFLYPLDCLLPLALSNLRPLALTKGLAWEWGVPAAPKCLTASRALRGPCRRMVFFPVGALRASWSKVMISPRRYSPCPGEISPHKTQKAESQDPSPTNLTHLSEIGRSEKLDFPRQIWDYADISLP